MNLAQIDEAKKSVQHSGEAVLHGCSLGLLSRRKSRSIVGAVCMAFVQDMVGNRSTSAKLLGTSVSDEGT